MASAPRKPLTAEELAILLAAAVSSNLQNEATPAPTPAPAAVKSQKRCCAVGCKAKLPLTAFACHCGQKFCTAHRYPEDHMCPHDYRKEHKDILLKTMSTAIVGEKLEKV